MVFAVEAAFGRTGYSVIVVPTPKPTREMTSRLPSRVCSPVAAHLNLESEYGN